jgi:hypothetical protein
VGKTDFSVFALLFLPTKLLEVSKLNNLIDSCGSILLPLKMRLFGVHRTNKEHIHMNSIIIATDWRPLQKPAGELFRIDVKTGRYMVSEVQAKIIAT